MPGKVTAQQVAALAGVSQSAVSRVFSPGGSVSPKMVDKVHAAAESLGYRPNVIARSLITGRSRIIGLVVAYLENQFYPEAVEKLSKALQEEGYHVLILMAANTSGDNAHVLEEILAYQVDGLIMASVAFSSEVVQRCEALGVPVVLFNRIVEMDRLAAVTSDNVAGGRKIGEFLLAGGHERIAHIAGWEGASTQRDREAGFRSALSAAGRDLHSRGVSDFNADKARIVTREMFDVAADDRPDAVFAANDHMAFAVMDVLRDELGLGIPEDVSVVGYDDVPPAAWGGYSLTTMRQRTNKMVAETVRRLIERIDDPTARPHHIQIDGPLIVRRSARVPEGWPR